MTVTDLKGLLIISLVFMTAGIIGILHNFLRGYSDVYLAIFVLLTGGFMTQALFIWYHIKRLKRSEQ